MSLYSEFDLNCINKLHLHRCLFRRDAIRVARVRRRYQTRAAAAATGNKARSENAERAPSVPPPSVLSVSVGLDVFNTVGGAKDGAAVVVVVDIVMLVPSAAWHWHRSRPMERADCISRVGRVCDAPHSSNSLHPNYYKGEILFAKD